MSLTLDQGLGFLESVGEVCGDPKGKDALDQWTVDTKGELSDRMRGQVSPDGSPFAPLAPSTIARKGHNLALFDTNALHESVVTSGGGHIEQVTDNSVTLGTEHQKRGKPVALYMQEGTSRVPARPFIGVTDNMADNAAELIADDILKQIAGL
jgi:hypothetical protein